MPLAPRLVRRSFGVRARPPDQGEVKKPEVRVGRGEDDVTLYVYTDDSQQEYLLIQQLPKPDCA